MAAALEDNSICDSLPIGSPRRSGNYLFIDRIAVNGRNEVHLAVHRRTGQHVVVKVVRKDPTISMNCVASRGLGRREGKIHSKLVHKHVLPIIEVVEEKDRTSLVIAHASGGDLRKHVINKGNRSGKIRGIGVEETRQIFRQLVEAVSYVHNEGYVHRDIKPENIFLDASGNVLLGDFGLAGRWKAGGRKRKSCGTHGYLAPCLLSEHPLYEGPEVDCWSLGAVLYFCLHGTSPFYAHSDLKTFKKTREGKYQWRHENVAAHHLVSRLLEVDRLKRATIAEILAHPFLNPLADVTTELVTQHKSKRSKRASTSKKEKKKHVMAKKPRQTRMPSLYTISE